MKTQKEHKITTIADFMNVVTEENINMLTGNFYGMTLQWLKIKTKYPNMKFESFKWIDDGLIEIRAPEIFQINITENQDFKELRLYVESPYSIKDLAKQLGTTYGILFNKLQKQRHSLTKNIPEYKDHPVIATRKDCLKKLLDDLV